MQKAQTRREVVILDRDGTLVIDHGYNSDPARLQFLPGVAEGLRTLTKAGFRLIVATNQSGVGRGFFELSDVHAAHARLASMMEESGSYLTGAYFCPHLPECQCECRKPRPGMMIQAARDHEFDPSFAFVVGDRASDVGLATAVKAKSILLGAGNEACSPSHVAKDFGDAVRFILKSAEQRASSM